MITVRPLPIVTPTAPDGVVSMPEWEWKTVVKDYEENPNNLARAWKYLSWHPAFWSPEPLGTGMVVTPVGWLRGVQFDMSESDDGTTVTWMEVTPVLWDGDPTDEELAQLAPGWDAYRVMGVSNHAFSTCLLLMAQMVHDRWGNDREFLKIPELEEGKWYG